MTKTKRKDVITGIILTVFGILIRIFSINIKVIKTSTYSVGSNVFPIICADLLILLGILLIVTSYKKKDAKVVNQSETEEHPEQNKLSKNALSRLLITTVTLILFTALLDKLGFIICAILLQFVLMATLAPETKKTKKDMIKYLIISVCASFIIYILFVKFFKLMLPNGLLKGVL